MILEGLCMCMCGKSLQLCTTLCDPMDHSLPGSSVHRILQARILEWVATPGRSSFRDLLDPGIKPVFRLSPALIGEFFTTSATCEGVETITISKFFFFYPLRTNFTFLGVPLSPLRMHVYAVYKGEIQLD